VAVDVEAAKNTAIRVTLLLTRMEARWQEVKTCKGSGKHRRCTRRRKRVMMAVPIYQNTVDTRTAKNATHAIVDIPVAYVPPRGKKGQAALLTVTARTRCGSEKSRSLSVTIAPRRAQHKGKHKAKG
jgi:hypothetical protein